MAIRAARPGHDPSVVGPALLVRCIVPCQPTGYAGLAHRAVGRPNVLLRRSVLAAAAPRHSLSGHRSCMLI